MNLVCLLLYLLLLFVPLGQLGKIPVGGALIGVYINDLLVLCVLLAWLGYSFGIRRELDLPPLSPWLFLFSFFAFISLVNGKRFIGWYEFLISGMYLVRWIMYSSLYFVVYDLAKTFPYTEDRLLGLLVISGLLLSLAGFLQLVILPDFTVLDPELGWDPHKNRLASSFFDPNFTGAYLVLTLTLIFSRILYGGPFVLLVLSAVVFVALILTFSRSAWLMLAVSTGIFGALKSRKLLILAFIAFFSAYLLVPRVQTRIAGGVDPDDSAAARIVSWRNTLKVVKVYPVIGVGFNSFRYAQARFGFFDFRDPLGGKAGAGADSSLLLVFATTGIIGLAFFILLLFKALWPVWVTCLTAPDTSVRSLYLACLAGMAGLLVESNFINSLFYPWIMIWVWVLLALANARVRDSA